MSGYFQIIALCNFVFGWAFGFWAGCRHVTARRLVDLDNERRARGQAATGEGD